jgi:ABC-type multidrug transport system fused ATPase/permease subunit
VQRCDQIIVLQGGAIVEHGSSAELLRQNGTFAGYWASQFGREHRPAPELSVIG